jgi:polyisoprenyl-phosphate glycosyltransferase
MKSQSIKNRVSKASLVSIISPVFNEEKSIKKFIEKLIKTVSQFSYEIILVNDGSTDHTIKEIRLAQLKNRNIKIINFCRNFGQQAAIMAGLAHCNGNCAVVLDCDLQDPPEIIPRMIRKWKDGYKIIFAKRKTRDDSIFKKVSAILFYRLLSIISRSKIISDVGDFYLLDRKAIDKVLKIKNSTLFLRGQICQFNLSQTQILIDRQKRVAGKSHYSIYKMIKLAINACIVFSILPDVYFNKNRPLYVIDKKEGFL